MTSVQSRVSLMIQVLYIYVVRI